MNKYKIPSAPKIAELGSEKTLKDLNAYLEFASFISGFKISKTDTEAFSKIKKTPPANLPHLLRWYNNVSSYPKEFLNTVGDAKPQPGAPKKEASEDEDVDLFGSEDEEDDAEATRVREERLKAYNEKKSKKPELIAKSSIVLDVKPWDDETNMKEMEDLVRTIEREGLVWGASKLVPVGYGINKLQLMCVVEDAKVSVDELVETIEQFEDHVQSVDIAAFNKI